ncbi:MAG: hypothetical protein Q4B58_02410 [Bacteroidales bacterium]|nr:hypothetical protein [Bacteroidales bacterium]
MKQDFEKAVYWYKEAIRHGDLQYAPSSLGDIYRKGQENVERNPTLAIEAYKISTDPYAWFRLGQSYEEGWTAVPDMQKAMEYYEMAAARGHHLALKRLKCIKKS